MKILKDIFIKNNSKVHVMLSMYCIKTMQCICETFKAALISRGIKNIGFLLLLNVSFHVDSPCRIKIILRVNFFFMVEKEVVKKIN